MNTQAWLTWWHSGYWRAAHESWRDDAWFILPPSQQQRLTRLHADAIGRQWGIAPAPLPQPQPLLLAIAALDEAEKARLLSLIAAVCGAETALPGEDKIWCRRLAKGLRPESWLPEAFSPTPAATLTLLQALAPDCWSRLRMAFTRDAALACPASPPALPVRRLLAAWEAALWRCRPVPEEQETNDVAA